MMDIGYLCTEPEHLTDAILAQVAERAQAAGLALAGTVQLSPPEASREKCDIVLRLLPGGPVRNISLALGPLAISCRLDAGALEEAVMLVHQRLGSAQGLVVNKFGRQEAAGRGLVEAIGMACSENMPVLVGVSPVWRQAFLDFAAGTAEPLQPDVDQILAWLTARARPLPAGARSDGALSAGFLAAGALAGGAV